MGNAEREIVRDMNYFLSGNYKLKVADVQLISVFESFYSIQKVKCIL